MSPHDDLLNADHIDRLPPEVRGRVLRMCPGRARAGHYFVTYLNHAKTIRLHYELFHCDESHSFRFGAGCLHQDYVADGSHYRLSKSYFGRCDD